jgi:hypothetical protein
MREGKLGALAPRSTVEITGSEDLLRVSYQRSVNPR